MAQAAATGTKKKSTARKTGTTAKGKKKDKIIDQEARELAAYYNWLDRGAPIGDDQYDWFMVSK